MAIAARRVLPPLTLHGPALFVARIVWVAIALFAAAAFVATLPTYYSDTLSLHGSGCCVTRNPAEWRAGLHELGLSPSIYAGVDLVLEILVSSAMFLIGLVIFLRKSEEWIALFVSLVFVGFGLVSTNSTPVGLPDWFTFLANAYTNGAYLAFFIIPLVFPNGRFVPRWSAWILVPLLLLSLGSTIAPHSPLDANTWPGALNVVLLIAALGTVLSAPVYRYMRVSDVTQRKQTKWVMYVLVLSIAALILGAAVIPNIPGITAQPMQAVVVDLVTKTLVGVAFMLVPVGFAIAILRYRLWDIDLLINRTLVYGSLTLSLGALYLVGVIILQALFRAVTGQRSEVAVALVTLAVAALFNPWHRRLQSFIDRRFYRRRYDATQTLAAFNARLRDEVNLDQLGADLLAVTHDAIQPTGVGLWLRGTDRNSS